MSDYQVVLLFDAHKIIDVKAKTPKEALESAENEYGQMTLCYECARQMEMGDCNGAFVYSRNDKKVLDTSSAGILECQLAAIKDENERLKNSESINEELLKQQNKRLKARVAELEAKDHEIFLVASSVAEDVGKGKYQIGYSAACADIVGRFYSKEPANEG